MKPQRSCRDEDIEHFLGVPSGSEDDLEISDEESDDDLIRIRDLVMNEVEQRPQFFQENLFEQDFNELPSTSSISAGNAMNEIRPSVSGHVNPSSAPPVASTSSAKSTTRRVSSQAIPLRPAHPNIRSGRNKRRYIWRKTVFQPPPTDFQGNESLGDPFTEFDTPLQYFLYFFDEDLLQHVAEESTKYSIQKNPAKPHVVSVLELKKYLGICLLLGLIPQSNIRMLWNSELDVPFVLT